MRQNALIVLFAHIGQLRAGTRADIGPIDRILTCIGAGDDRARAVHLHGEMAKPAHPPPRDQRIAGADGRDRGAAPPPHDGLRWRTPARAVLAAGNRSLSLFATHHFEPTAPAEPGSGIANVT